MLLDLSKQTSEDLSLLVKFFLMPFVAVVVALN